MVNQNHKLRLRPGRRNQSMDNEFQGIEIQRKNLHTYNLRCKRKYWLIIVGCMWGELHIFGWHTILRTNFNRKDTLRRRLLIWVLI